MDRTRMRGILSQMHKIKSQKNSKSLQKDRLETFPYFFWRFVSLHGDKR